MLVIMRKNGESFLIGNDIEIQILDVQPNGVKIGISAPREVRILRKELVSEVRNANKESVIIPAKIKLSDLEEFIDKKD